MMMCLCPSVRPSVTLICYMLKTVFSSTGQRPEGLMRWAVVRRPSVRPSVSKLQKSLLLLSQ